MIMLSWITKVKLELMAYEAMFATDTNHQPVNNIFLSEQIGYQPAE
jgi:hypothetical protein